MIFDAIIIGGGASGLSSALWCAELGLNVVLLEAEKELGGQLLWIHNSIKNHLGVEAKNGRELRDVFLKQTKDYNFEVRLEAKVGEINVHTKTVVLENGEKFSAKALIIATGVRRRKLNVAGEEEFQNKGILESGKREQHLARNKNAMVVGGGDAALENALILAEVARKVTLMHRGKNFRAREEFVQKVKSNPKIEILTETILTKINGSKAVETVEIKNLKTNETEFLPTEVLLIRIGVVPNTENLSEKINLDENGYVKTNGSCETSIEGIFSVGDVANAIAPTVSTAVGSGATAAKAIFRQSSLWNIP